MLKYIVCLLILGLATTRGVSQSAVNLPAHAKPPPGWFSWTKKPWTGDNTPYHAARVQIEHARNAPSELEKLEAQYERIWHAKPNDPLAFYCWGYSKYVQVLNNQSSAPLHAELAPVEEAFEKVPSPHTRDFDRLRYLVGEYFTPHAEATPIAERLLKEDPNDYTVGYALASAYLYVYYPARIKEALAICEHLKQIKPNEASTYATIGLAYVLWYTRDQNPANARAIVANYKKYLELAPPNATFRKRAEQIIEQYKDKTER